jgi:hypothetical protein
VESWLLGNLPTQNISASALAQELNQRHRHNASSTSCDEYKSAYTAEFKSTRSDNSDHFSTAQEEEVEESIFSKDAFSYSREAPIEVKEEPERITQERTMAAKTVSAKKTTIAPVPAPSGEMEQPLYVDPAEKIYGTAKGVWGWGKGIIIFSPFLGVAEGIAGKVMQTVGSSLADVDSAVMDKLHTLDDGVLNPAIKKVVDAVMGAVMKTEKFMKPIIIVCLKPIDFMLKREPENGTHENDTPEVTPAVAMN